MYLAAAIIILGIIGLFMISPILGIMGLLTYIFVIKEQ